jgi:YVTN family beta-propeller protein
MGAVTSTVATGTSPNAVAYDPGDGDVYVGNYGSTPGTVTVFNAASDALITTITVGTEPYALTYDSANGYVYVANFQSNSVSVINGANYSLISHSVNTILVGTGPSSIAYDSANGYLYVTDFTSNTYVSVINGANNSLISHSVNTITVGTSPSGAAYDTTNGYVYVSNMGSASVSVINPASEAVIAATPVGTNPISIAFDRGNGYLYTSNYNAAGTMSVINGANNSLITHVVNSISGVGTNPWGAVCNSGNGEIYVADYGGTTVNVVSTTANAVMATITVGTGPASIAFDQDNGNLYVTNYNSNTMSVISTMLMVGAASPSLIGTPVNSLIATISSGGYALVGTAYDSGNGYMYVTQTNGFVLEINPATNALMGTIAVGSTPYGIAYDSGNGDVYVGNCGSGTVSVINGGSNMVVATIPGFNNPFAMTYDSGNGEVYVANEGGAGTVSAINGVTNTIVSTLAVGSEPDGIAYDSGNGDIYVANINGNTVSVINGATNMLLTTIPGITNPWGVAYDPVNGYVYVSNYNSGSVSVISGATNTVVGTVPVGTQPSDSAYDSANGDVYVANRGAASVTVISGISDTVVSTIGVGSCPWGVSEDTANGNMFVANQCSETASVISALSGKTVPQSASLDVGQSLLIIAPIGGEGTGDVVMTMSVSPLSGLSCSRDSLGEYQMSGACISNGTTGVYTVTMMLTDSAGNSVDSTITVTVMPAPLVTLPSSSVNSADIGQSVTFATSASSGTGQYLYYTWSGLPPPCVGTGSIVSCVVTTIGSFPVSVSVTDSNGATSASSLIRVFNVYTDPSVTVASVTVSQIDIGQTEYFTAGASGGSGNDIFSWGGFVPSDGCTATSKVASAWLNCTPATSAAGTSFSVSAQVTDSNGVSATSYSSVVQVNPDPVVSTPVASLGSVDVGQSVTFSTTASLGTGSYTGYAWFESAPYLGCTLDNSPSITCWPTVAGIGGTVSVYVTDSAGCSSGTSGGCTAVYVSSSEFTVYADPTISAAPTPSAASADVGQNATFVASATDGTGTYSTYTWTGLPSSGCSGLTTATVVCIFGSSVTLSIDVSVTDSNGITSGVSPTLSFPVYADPQVSTPTPSQASADIGQGPITFSTAASQGTSSYSTYAWSGLPSGCSGTTTAVASCPVSSFTTPTTYSISVTVTDSNGKTSAPSGARAFTVYADPQSSTPVGNVTSADSGQSATFTTIPSLGTSTYTTYTWNGVPVACAGSTPTPADTCSFSVGSATKYLVSVTVTDSNGQKSVAAGSLTFWAYPDPAVSAAPTPSQGSADVGQTATFTATASGGTGSYSAYAWSGLPSSGCSGATTSAVVCTFSAAASLSIKATVTDSNGWTSSVSPALAFTVYLDPTVSAPTPSSPSADVAQSSSVVFGTVAARGTLTYSTYAWSGLPAGCTGTATATVNCLGSVFTTATTYSITATVTDSDGETSAASSALAFTVYADPQVSTPVGNVTSADSGQVAGFTTTASLGTGSYSTFTWSGLPASGCSGTTTSTPSCTLNVAAVTKYTISVTVTDSNSKTSVSSSSLTFWAYPDPSVSAAPAPSQSSGDIGQAVTFTVTASGGTGTYSSYAWSGLPASGCSGTTTATVVCVLGTVAMLSVKAAVTDSNGWASSLSPALSFQVYSDPAVGLTESVSSGDIGQGVTFTSTASGGYGTYSYAWNDLPSGTGCFGATATISCTSLTAPVGPFSITVKVTDSNSYAVTSGAVSFTVYSDVAVVGAPTTSTTSVDVGQSVIFTSPTPSGGSGGNTYSWTGLPTGCSSSGAATATCIPTASGTFTTVKVAVTDSNGFQATSSALSFTVDTDPSVAAPTGNATGIDLGWGLVAFSAVPSGGSGGNTYVWNGLPTGCVSVSSTTDACTPTGTGTFSITVTVKDSNTYSMTSTALSFTVYSIPTVGTPAANVTSADVGWKSVGFSSSTPSGGSGVYAYAWSGLPSGCAGAGASFSCTPTGIGTFSTKVVVTDSTNHPYPATSGTLSFTVNADPQVGIPTESSASVDLGQSVTFASAKPTGGTGVYSYSWAGLPTGCSSSGEVTDSCTPTAIGTFSFIEVSVTDSYGFTSAYGGAASSFQVLTDPAVTVVETASSGDIGQSVTFTSTASGGTGTYSYAWSNLPSGTGCSGTTAAITCTSLTAPTGPFPVTVKVTDSNSYAVTSSAVTFTVYSDLVVSGAPTDSATSVDVGQSVIFTSPTPTGGSGGNTYSWTGLPTGCSSSGAATATCIPTSPGTFATVKVAVTDSDGFLSTSSALSFTVDLDPSVGPIAANVTASDQGWGAVMFTASPSGGSGGNSYAWSGLPTGCVTVNAITDSCTPTGAGTFTVAVTVKDSNSYSVTSTGLSFTVYSDPTVGTPTANVTSADSGWKVVAFTSASPSGGDPGYTYTWGGLPAGCASTSASFACTPTSTGTFSVTVKVKDSTPYPYPVISSILSFTVYSDLTVAGAPTPGTASVDVGQTVIFTSPAPSGGSGGYLYLWSGLPTGCSSSGASTDTCTPTGSGPFNSVMARIMDSNDNWASTSTLSFTVYSDLTVGAPTANATSSDLGWKSVMFTSSVPSGGSAGLTYSWNGLPAGCSGVTTSITCTPSAAGTFSVSVTVKDSNSYSATSNGLAFTVYNDPSVAGTPTESVAAADVGQPITFTSPTLTGGSGGDTYTWSGLPTGCSSSGTPTDTCIPTGAGAFASVKVKVTDSNGYTSTASSAAASLTVSSDPTVALTESVSSGDYGQSVTFTSAPSGGAGSYTYAWNDLPTGTGCSGATVIITCTSLAAPAGTFSVSVTVTDQNGYGVTSGVATFAVYTDPSVSGSPTASVSSVDLGQSVTFTSPAPSGGSGGYSYSWSNLPTGCSSSGVPTVSCIPSGTGSFASIRVAVTDSNGITSAVSGNAASFTVNADPAVSIPSPTAASAYIDQSSSVGFSTIASLGTTPYSTYAWSGLPSGCAGTATASVTCAGTVFTAVTTYSISVTVTDSAGVTSAASGALAFTVYAEPQASTPVGNVTSADSGQVAQFTTVASFGSGSYASYSWTGLPASGCLGTTTSSPSCTFTVASATKYTISAKVTDSNGQVSAASGSLVFWAYPVPTITSAPAPSQSSSDVGQTVTITVAASSGTGSYSTYAWSGLPASKCSGTTSATVVCAFTSASTLSVSATVTDSNGVRSASSPTLSFTVNADPVASTPTPSAASVDVGHSGAVTFSTVASLGTLTYATYAWSGLPAGCTGTTTSTASCSGVFTTAATYPISATVTDSNGMTSAASGALTFTVYSDPVVSTPAGNVSSADSGQSATFTTVAGLGTGSYLTFTWIGLPAGCTGTTTSTVSCSFVATTATAYSISVTAKDSNGVTSPSSAPLMFWAYPAPTVTGAPAASQVSADVGQTVTLTASASGGTGSYIQFTWTGLPATGCSGVTTAVVVCAFETVTTLPIKVTVTDSNGVTSAPSSMLSFSVYSDPVVASPTPSASAADLGQTVTFTAAASLGSGGYTYTWTVLQSGLGCTASIISTLTCVPTVVGTNYVVSVAVTDSNHNTSEMVSSAAFSVYGVPSVATPTATNTSLDLGQSTTLTTTSALTIGSVSYYWSGLPAGCQSSNAARIVCKPTASGLYSITASMVDSQGMNVTSSPIAIVVSGSLQAVTVTASAGTVDSGQLLVMYASASGGSGAYTYSWSSLPSGCANANSASIECAPSVTAAWKYTVYVNVSDSNSAVETGTVSVMVLPALTMTLAASRTSVLVDSGSVMFNATVAGGSVPYDYTWFVNGTAVTNTGDEYVMDTTHAGTYLVSVSVKDANGVTVTSGTTLLTVSSPAPTSETTSSSTNSVTGMDWILLVLMLVTLVLVVGLIAMVMGRRRKRGPSGPTPPGPQGRAQVSSPPSASSEPVPATASVTVPPMQSQEEGPKAPEWEE